MNFKLIKKKLRNDFYSIKNTELRNQIFKTKNQKQKDQIKNRLL
jgi:hypothetical protein